MKCPHCGDKIHDPGLDRFCPSCGKELPHESEDDKAMARDIKVSGVLLITSIILIVVGFSFMLPDIILRYIIPEMKPWYWPYDAILALTGMVLLVIRHPFAKRSRKFNAVLLEKIQTMWTCSYCGAQNVPGSIKCESCGAPLKRT